jgi:Ca2+-binding EF-hand superfamily protein
MGKKVWIISGIVATALGVTAVVAHAQRGSHDGGWGHSRDGYEQRGHWRRGWRNRSDRSMTKEEFDADTKSRFSKWDVNSDGVVDKVEAIAGVSGRMEGHRHHYRGQRWERRMRRYDADGDGKVTKEEVEARVTKKFQRADLNGDGVVTDADLFPLLRGRNILRGEARMGRRGHHGHRRGGRRLKHLIAANVDKNDEVTLQEMQDYAAMRFARFDRNKDGVLDNADREALRKEIVEYMALRLLHRYGAGPNGQLTAEQYNKYRSEKFTRREAEPKKDDEVRGSREGSYDDRDDDRNNERSDNRDDERSDGDDRPIERNELKGDSKPEQKPETKQ